MIDLRLGDCAKVMAEMPDGCIDLTVTSPPYDNLRTYNGYVFDFEAIAQQLYRVTKPGGVVVWVVGDATINGSETGTSFRQALYFMGLGFNCETMIYKVCGTGAKGSNLAYWQAFEFMFVLSKGGIKTFNPIVDHKNKTVGNITDNSRNKNGTRLGIYTRPAYSKRDNVWIYAVGVERGTQDHPAPFPEALARDHILSWSNPGDMILDPMMGSGTVGKTCVLYQRNFTGIEISSEYLAIARKRIETAQLQMRLPFD
jgi:DNA modification methylase